MTGKCPENLRNLLHAVMLLMWLSAMQPVMGADAPVTLSVSLVCGTDKPSPSFQYAGPVHQELQDKFTKIFKWEHYFLLTKKEVNLPLATGKKIRMSKDCELIFQVLEEGKVLQVQLLEPDESVRTLKHPLEPIWKEGELFVIAGDNKESAGDAWFLVIASPRPESKESKDSKGDPPDTESASTTP